MKKIHLPIRATVRLVKILAAGSIVGSSLWLGWFLWENFYLPLTQASSIAELRANVAVVSIKRDMLRKIIDEIAKVNSPLSVDPKFLRNPFSAVPLPTPPAPVQPPAVPVNQPE